MADNTNIEALIESRIEAAISAVQDLPQLLEEAAENNSVVLLDMWYKILSKFDSQLDFLSTHLTACSPHVQQSCQPDWYPSVT